MNFIKLVTFNLFYKHRLISFTKFKNTIPHVRNNSEFLLFASNRKYKVFLYVANLVDSFNYLLGKINN